MPSNTPFTINYIYTEQEFESCHPDNNHYCKPTIYSSTGYNMPNMPDDVTSGIVNIRSMKEKVFATKPHLYDAGGDVSKQWYIHYYCVHPVTGALGREKVSKGFTRLKTAEERYAHSVVLKKQIQESLDKGVHPYFENKILPSVSQRQQLLTGSVKLEKVMRESVILISESTNPRTLQNYYRYINNFIEWLKTKSINSQNFGAIDNDGADRYLDWLLTFKKYSNKTRNEELSFFKMLFRYLKEKKRCLINPFENCKNKKHIAKFRQHYRENVRVSIIDHLREHDKVLLLFVETIYYSMRRNGELLKLLIGDIDMIDSRIIIRPEISKTGKTGFVEIPAALYNSFKQNNIHLQPAHYYLFGMGGVPGVNPIGKNNLYKRWRKVRSALNLPLSLGIYNWKHTSVIMSYQAGIPLNDIKAQGGWTSMAMVDTYMKDLDTRESDALRNNMPAIDSVKKKLTVV